MLRAKYKIIGKCNFGHKQLHSPLYSSSNPPLCPYPNHTQFGLQLDTIPTRQTKPSCRRACYLVGIELRPCAVIGHPIKLANVLFTPAGATTLKTTSLTSWLNVSPSHPQGTIWRLYSPTSWCPTPTPSLSYKSSSYQPMQPSKHSFCLTAPFCPTSLFFSRQLVIKS